MIRPFRWETERFGEYSKPGESVYDHPFLWGSRRIGPGSRARRRRSIRTCGTCATCRIRGRSRPSRSCRRTRSCSRNDLDFGGDPEARGRHGDARRPLRRGRRRREARRRWRTRRRRWSPTRSRSRAVPPGCRTRRSSRSIAYLQRLGRDATQAAPAGGGREGAMNPLADILGASGLHVFAEIALVLFLIAFGTIVTQLLTARQSTHGSRREPSAPGRRRPADPIVGARVLT